MFFKGLIKPIPPPAIKIYSLIVDIFDKYYVILAAVRMNRYPIIEENLAD
jgi:hypothetical protein